MEFPPFVLRLSKYELGERAEQPNPKPVIPSAAEESKIPGPQQGSPVPTLNMNNKAPVPSNSAAPDPSQVSALTEIEWRTFSHQGGSPHDMESFPHDMDSPHTAWSSPVRAEALKV